MSDKDSICEIIKRRTITTFLQPIVHSRKYCAWGYEALSRGPLLSEFRKPEMMAKYSSALGIEFDFECLCINLALKKFFQSPIEGRLFVNVSAETLNSSNVFLAAILPVLTEYKIDAERIVLELTEHSPINNIHELKYSLTRLRHLGFSFALDDLGAGYSSLRLWSELDPDYVKIDRHFIHNIENDMVKQRFVRSLMDLARHQGCRVIAEGVQTRAEAQWLAENQVRFMQGFYFSRPRIRPQTIKASRFPVYSTDRKVASNVNYRVGL